MVIRAILALPVNNADSERCFLVARQIYWKDRSHLECTTVPSLLAVKLNVDEDGFKSPKALFEVN